MKNATASVFMNGLQRLLRLRGAKNRRDFLIEQLESEIRTSTCEEAYWLRKRIWRQFVKQMPTATCSYNVRVHGFFELIGQLKQVPGEIVECGVGRGRFLTVLLDGVAYHQLDKQVFGFDSFAGFPPATAHDVGQRVDQAGQISGWDDASIETVQDTVRTLSSDADLGNAGDSSRLHLIPGFFEDTLAAHLPARISLLHLDADLYESTKTCLLECLPRMSAGGWIVFDELHEPERWPGVHKAVEELCVPRGLHPEWIPSLMRLGIHVPMN
jgi:hypothetical protein